VSGATQFGWDRDYSTIRGFNITSLAVCLILAAPYTVWW